MLIFFRLRSYQESHHYISIFSEDQDAGIFYLSSKFELDRSTNNGDLLSDTNHWEHKHTDKHTQTHAHTYTLRETEI